MFSDVKNSREGSRLYVSFESGFLLRKENCTLERNNIVLFYEVHNGVKKYYKSLIVCVSLT